MARIESSKVCLMEQARPYHKRYGDRYDCCHDRNPFCECCSPPHFPRTRARDALVIYDDVEESCLGINLQLEHSNINVDDLCCRDTYIRLQRKNDRCAPVIDIPVHSYTPTNYGVNLNINWCGKLKFIPNGQYEGEVVISGVTRGVWLFIKMPREGIKAYEFSNTCGPPMPHSFRDMNDGLRSPIVKVEEPVDTNACKEECDECSQ